MLRRFQDPFADQDIGKQAHFLTRFLRTIFHFPFAALLELLRDSPCDVVVSFGSINHVSATKAEARRGKGRGGAGKGKRRGKFFSFRLSTGLAHLVDWRHSNRPSIEALFYNSWHFSHPLLRHLRITTI